MQVRIIVDSTVDLLPQIRQRVSVVPLTVHFGEEEYIDGVTITHQAFYEKLVESDVLPTTSQASPSAFEEIFSQVSRAGQSAVVITLSSQLSGTCQSARIAAEEFENVFVVDSGSASIGAAILAEQALSMADAGMDAQTIAEELTRQREEICVVAMLDTLEYLKKGGRISSTVAFVGGMLSIKPVVSLQEGKIVMLGKARGSKQGNNLLVQQIQKAGGVDFDRPVMLGYTGMSDVLLKKYVEDSKALWEDSCTKLRSTVIGSVIGTHAGPGAVAVAFFKKK